MVPAFEGGGTTLLFCYFMNMVSNAQSNKDKNKVNRVVGGSRCEPSNIVESSDSNVINYLFSITLLPFHLRWKCCFATKNLPSRNIKMFRATFLRRKAQKTSTLFLYSAFSRPYNSEFRIPHFYLPLQKRCSLTKTALKGVASTPAIFNG